MPIWIYLTVIDRSLEERKGLQDFFKCFDIFSAMASIFHLVAICVERFIAISQPFAHISTRFYQAMITAAWIFATLVSLVYNIEYVKTSYAIVVFVAGFLLPAVVMTFMYGRIFRIARALTKRTPGSQTLENARKQRISEETEESGHHRCSCLGFIPFSLVTFFPSVHYVEILQTRLRQLQKPAETRYIRQVDALQ